MDPYLSNLSNAIAISSVIPDSCIYRIGTRYWRLIARRFRAPLHCKRLQWFRSACAALQMHSESHRTMDGNPCSSRPETPPTRCSTVNTSYDTEWSSSRKRHHVPLLRALDGIQMHLYTHGTEYRSTTVFSWSVFMNETPSIAAQRNT